jgi:hypothetical protein
VTQSPVFGSTRAWKIRSAGLISKFTPPIVIATPGAVALQGTSHVPQACPKVAGGLYAARRGVATAIYIEVAGISWSTPPGKRPPHMDDKLGNLPEGRSRFDVPESTIAAKGVLIALRVLFFDPSKTMLSTVML